MRITWRDGRTDFVDMAGVVAAFAPFEPLRDPPAFAAVHVADWGSGVEWDNGLDYASDSLDRLAEEQRDMVGADFRRWQAEMGLSIQETADLFEVAASTVKEYRKPERKLPIAWQIACRAMKNDRKTFLARYRPPLTGRPKKQVA